jgi:hypothetical protein
MNKEHYHPLDVTPLEEPMDPDLTSFKAKINGLLWEILPPYTTLAQAEGIAVAMFNAVLDAWHSKPALRDERGAR